MSRLRDIKIICLLALLGAMLFYVTAFAQPGSPEDPLVSRAYLNSRIAALEAQIEALAWASPPGEVSEAPPVHGIERELFHVVRAEPGMVLIGHASTEIILRAGEATAVAGYNGLANVTSGVDLMNGQAVPLNNLLIVPQSDGRGMRFHSDSYLMIRGGFHFQ